MLKNLTPRERALLLAVALISVFTFAWLGVYEPMVDGRKILKRKIIAKTKELAQVMELAKRVREKKGRYIRLNAKLGDSPGKPSEVATIESLADLTGIRENIISMSPQPPDEIDQYKESEVTIKLVKVSLPQLKAFLESMMTSQGVMRVKRISIKPQFEDAAMLDISMSVASYERVDG